MTEKPLSLASQICHAHLHLHWDDVQQALFLLNKTTGAFDGTQNS